MSFFILKSGEKISSSDCFRFQNYWENQNNQHIASYDRIMGEVKESDYFNSKYLGYSDYSGSIGNKANQRIFLEKFGDLDGVIEIYGSHSYSDVLIKLELLNNNEELREILLDLENYGSIDEDNHWMIEEEAKEEALDFVILDFKRELLKKWNYDFGYLNNEFLQALFYKCVEKTEVEWYWNYAEACFPVHQMIKKLTREDFLEIFSLTKEKFPQSIRKEKDKENHV